MSKLVYWVAESLQTGAANNIRCSTRHEVQKYLSAWDLEEVYSAPRKVTFEYHGMMDAVDRLLSEHGDAHEYE